MAMAQELHWCGACQKLTVSLVGAWRKAKNAYNGQPQLTRDFTCKDCNGFKSAETITAKEDAFPAYKREKLIRIQAERQVADLTAKLQQAETLEKFTASSQSPA